MPDSAVTADDSASELPVTDETVVPVGIPVPLTVIPAKTPGNQAVDDWDVGHVPPPPTHAQPLASVDTPVTLVEKPGLTGPLATAGSDRFAGVTPSVTVIPALTFGKPPEPTVTEGDPDAVVTPLTTVEKVSVGVPEAPAGSDNVTWFGVLVVSTDTTVVPGGIPEPLTYIPAATAAKLVAATVVDPAVVVTVDIGSEKVSMSPESEQVALALSVTVFPAGAERTVVPGTQLEASIVPTAETVAAEGIVAQPVSATVIPGTTSGKPPDCCAPPLVVTMFRVVPPAVASTVKAFGVAKVSEALESVRLAFCVKLRVFPLTQSTKVLDPMSDPPETSIPGSTPAKVVPVAAVTMDELWVVTAA
jgi:hypothetical protein